MHTVPGGVQDQAPPAHLPIGLEPPDYLHYLYSEGHQADGKQTPCDGHPVSPGFAPRQRYQQARCRDKEPPLGPTNGVSLGTTQKGRWDAAQAICHPFLHRHAQHGANEGQGLLGALERRHRAGNRPPQGRLGRGVLRATIPSPRGTSG